MDICDTLNNMHAVKIVVLNVGLDTGPSGRITQQKI